MENHEKALSEIASTLHATEDNTLKVALSSWEERFQRQNEHTRNVYHAYDCHLSSIEADGEISGRNDQGK